jgi:hypothetical protein
MYQGFLDKYTYSDHACKYVHHENDDVGTRKHVYDCGRL